MWRHRVKVERVAEALLRFGRLDMDELDAAIENGAAGVERLRREISAFRV